VALLAFGCGSSSAPPGSDGASQQTGDAKASTPDVVGDAGASGDTSVEAAATPDGAASDAAEAGVDLAPQAPGSATVQIFNDSADDFALPEGTSFHVWSVGAEGTAADVTLKQGKYQATLMLPAGAQQLRLSERGPAGEDTLDYFQSATRTIPITVVSGGDVSAEFHLKWHWQPRHVTGTTAAPSCRGIRQVQFFDALHGLITIAQERTSAADYAHGSAVTTEDGGQTWTVASELMLAGNQAPFVPVSGNWFNNHHLLLQPDGQTVLSVGDADIARSTDFGKTWDRVPFRAPVWGPGGITYAGMARSGTSIYLAAETGGVQGSSQRTSISRSVDGGQTFAVALDRCARGEADVSCGDAHQPNLPLGFAGIDFACGPTGHCISLGSTALLVTRDDFATWKIMSPLPPNFACSNAQSTGRVIWIPGTMTAWVVVASSACGNPPPARMITTDGGETWSDWGPSPVSVIGFTKFADAQNGFQLEARNLFVTHDGGMTFRSTGPAPHQTASLDGFRLTVLDAEHAWVTAANAQECASGPFGYIASWQK
jgi:hypothetical protein